MERSRLGEDMSCILVRYSLSIISAELRRQAVGQMERNAAMHRHYIPEIVHRTCSKSRSPAPGLIVR